MSLNRARDLFNCLKEGAWRNVDRYLLRICGVPASELPVFEWYFLIGVAEIITRKDVWEVAINLQSTYEISTVLRKPHTTPVYNHGRFEPTNGINYKGTPYQFPFTPRENLQQIYRREYFNAVLHLMAHARRQNLLELMQNI